MGKPNVKFVMSGWKDVLNGMKTGLSGKVFFGEEYRVSGIWTRIKIEGLFVWTKGGTVRVANVLLLGFDD